MNFWQEKFGYGDFSQAFDPKYGDPYPVPIVMATEETLKGYGTIVTDFDKEEVEIVPWPVQGWRKLCEDTGTLGGTLSGLFKYKWQGDLCTSVNEAVVEGNYVTGKLPKNVSPKNRTHVLVKDIGYHPDGSQMFYPQNGEAFVAILALPGDDLTLESFQAFYCDGSFGIHIHPNVWHQPLYPVADEAVFLNKQGAVQGYVSADTVKEFGKFLLLPLTKPQ
ncbi:hypothetical protein ACF0H5_023127 [Mactra antiquata]